MTSVEFVLFCPTSVLFSILVCMIYLEVVGSRHYPAEKNIEVKSIIRIN